MTAATITPAAIEATIAEARSSYEEGSDAGAICAILSWLSINKDQAYGWSMIADMATTERELATARENVTYWNNRLSLWRAALAQLRAQADAVPASSLQPAA